MSLATLAEEVDVAASAFVYPVERGGAVDESEHLYPIYHACLGCPSADVGDSLFFSVGDACARHLYAVYVEVEQEGTCYHEFLMGHEADSVGLFAVTECGVHYFYVSVHEVRCDVVRRVDIVDVWKPLAYVYSLLHIM